MERTLGVPALDHFDLVVGTSTGGIITTALGAGLSAEEVVGTCVSNASTILPGPSRRFRFARRLARPKYRPDGLEAFLRRILGDRLLGESRVPLVIPSFDLEERTASTSSRLRITNG